MSEPTTRDILCICSLIANSCPPTEGHLAQCDAHYRAVEAIEAGAHREGATQAFEEARTVAALFGGSLPFDRSRWHLSEEIEAGITRAEEIFKKLPANTYDIIEEENDCMRAALAPFAKAAEALVGTANYPEKYQLLILSGPDGDVFITGQDLEAARSILAGEEEEEND
jgi:hypothetical protein